MRLGEREPVVSLVLFAESGVLIRISAQIQPARAGPDGFGAKLLPDAVAVILSGPVVLHKRYTRVAVRSDPLQSMEVGLIDAAQHRGVTTAMLAFLGSFLPKLGGVRFRGRRSFSPRARFCYAALRANASLILWLDGTLS